MKSYQGNLNESSEEILINFSTKFSGISRRNQEGFPKLVRRVFRGTSKEFNDKILENLTYTFLIIFRLPKSIFVEIPHNFPWNITEFTEKTLVVFPRKSGEYFEETLKRKNPDNFTIKCQRTYQGNVKEFLVKIPKMFP